MADLDATGHVPVLACAADERYLPHCAVMLLSALQTNPVVQVHFLHDESLNQDALEMLRDMVVAAGGTFRAHCIESSRVQMLPRLSELPTIMWYRIFLPELLPDQARVLYLDCDVLVQGDLAPLWKFPWQDCAVAAVQNILPEAYQHWPEEIGVSPKQYFNSGVLLMNLDLWRQQNSTQALLDFGQQWSTRLHWPDQDALNHVFKQRWQRLHPRYNAQNGLWFMPNRKQFFSRQEIRQATQHPMIVHFEGPGLVKPWHVFCKNPYRHQYRKLRALTPWPKFELRGSDHPMASWAWLPGRVLYALLRLRYRLQQKLKAG